MKTSPRLFLCCECPVGRCAVSVSVACPLLSLSLGGRAFPSPRLACRLSGRAAWRVCRAVVRCGWACRSFHHVGRRVGVSACRRGAAGAAGCLLTFLVSVFGEVDKAAFLVSAISAVGGTVAMRCSSCGSVRLANCLPCVARLG